MAKNISDYRDKHRGSDIFVLGSGPSLRAFDIEKIGKRPVICVNGSILKIKTPDYYFTSDGSQPFKHHWEYVKLGSFPVVASGAGAGDHIRMYGKIEPDRICYFSKKHSWVLDPTSDELIFGGTSTHCACHFAAILGAARIIVVGCDMSKGDNGEEYFWDYDNEEKDFAVRPDLMAGSLPIDQYESIMSVGWKEIKANNPYFRIEAWGGKVESIFNIYQGD